MKKIRILGAVTTGATILLLAFMISIIYSAQNVSFGLLEDVEIQPTEEIVAISIPFYVKNRGFYDIEDVDIFFQLRDSKGRIIAQSLNSLETVRAGSEHVGYLGVTLNSLDLFLNGFLNELLRNEPIELKAKASLNYALSWLGLEAEASIALTPSSLAKGVLRSLAKDFSISPGSSTLKFNDEGIAISLSISLNYTGWLPIQNLELKLEARNSTGFIVGSGEVTIEKLKLGQSQVSINITCTEELATFQSINIDTFTIYLKANLAGFTLEWTEEIILSAVAQS